MRPRHGLQVVQTFSLCLFIQVQVRLWKCIEDQDINCVCGAAIREGKHVIEMSMCNKGKKSEPTPLRTVKRSPGKLPRGIEVTRDIHGQSLDQQVTLVILPNEVMCTLCCFRTLIEVFCIMSKNPFIPGNVCLIWSVTQGTRLNFFLGNPQLRAWD